MQSADGLYLSIIWWSVLWCWWNVVYTEADIVLLLYTDSLYQLLLELSSSSCSSLMKSAAAAGAGGDVSALACCCLLSLVIARGDTGKLLTTVAAMLMYSTRLAAQHIQVPLSSLI